MMMPCSGSDVKRSASLFGLKLVRKGCLQSKKVDEKGLIAGAVGATAVSLSLFVL